MALYDCKSADGSGIEPRTQSADKNADLDRLNTADCEDLSRGVGAAESKSICIIECVAHEVRHEDRRSNARVERPAAAFQSARTAQTE